MICASCGHATPGEPCGACGRDPRLDARFRLQAMLGQGSFGTTWHALDAEDRPVALKEMLLRPELHDVVEREVRVLRQLRHPGVPRYVESFRSRSGRYASQVLVMELIEGQSLDQELVERRYGALDVVEVIEEIAGILAYLHGLSPPVIHRDIKPANIMRHKGGRLVLIDFGLVRDTVIATLGGTREVGTIGYQAPEQFAGDPEPVSDLYSLGAVAVRLLTRREPHELVRALYEPMRWRRHASVPTDVAKLIDALVAPEPGDRPSSALEVARRCAALRTTDIPRRAIEQPQPGPGTPPSERLGSGPSALLATEVPPVAVQALAPPSGPSERLRVEERWFELVRVDPGAYQRGSPEGEPGRSHDERMHLVTLGRSFMLGRVPVTRALWAAVHGVEQPEGPEAERPIEDISWHDALCFCNRLSELAGFEPVYHEEVTAPATAGFWGFGARPEQRAWRWRPTADGFRLPTEAEWEYSARAGAVGPFAGSASADEVAWHLHNAQGISQPVGCLAPNAWGLHDMSGNVWEWCWDWYHTYPSAPVEDPRGPSRGRFRVIRGGCAQYHRDYARVARRGGRRPERSYFYVGMRLARNAE